MHTSETLLCQSPEQILPPPCKKKIFFFKYSKCSSLKPRLFSPKGPFQSGARFIQPGLTLRCRSCARGCIAPRRRLLKEKLMRG